MYSTTFGMSLLYICRMIKTKTALDVFVLHFFEVDVMVMEWNDVWKGTSTTSATKLSTSLLKPVRRPSHELISILFT